MKIETKDLCFSYNGKDYIVNNLNYTFEGGKCYVLEGRNGSGKTTLSKLLCGILKPQKGRVEYDGVDIAKQKLSVISQKVGYLFQNPDYQFFASKVLDELSFPYQLNGDYCQEIAHKINDLLSQFKLEHLKESFPLFLSGGEKQRLALAVIFLRDVEFLILDEPSNAIDNEGKRFAAKLVNDFVSSGGGVLIITHDDDLRAMLDNAVSISLEELNEN
jgi:energy-coupling factor transporter ATP-binding protein EcfA2